MAAQYAFGFLKHRHEIDALGFEIRPLKHFDEAVARVLAEETAAERWYYPRPVLSPTEKVSLPAARFELPPTHLLITAGRSLDDQYGEFLVLALGFLLGLRLTIRGIGHMHRTPHEPGTLVSFLPSKHEIPPCMEKATAFWDAQPPRIRKLMFGAIHWFLVSQSFDHQYEEFAWAYTVLDNLHRIAWETTHGYRARFPKGQYRCHSNRPVALAAEFGSPLPASFADPDGKPGAVGRLVIYRNELVHEARWAGEPLGYAVSQDGHEMIMDLSYFCSQLILGLLGIDCGFRRYTNSRQIQGFDLRP